MNIIQDLVFSLREGFSGGGVALVVSLAVLVIVGLLVGASLYVAHILSPQGRLDLIIESRVGRSRRNPWLVRILVLAIVLITIISMSVYLAAPVTCARCHTETAYIKTLKASVHSGVKCMQCHGETGITAPIQNTLSYGKWGWEYYVRNVKPTSGSQAAIDQRRCLRCHQSILSGISVVGGMRVRHKDFVGTTTCSDCHTETAHKVADAAQTQPAMNLCLPCHDGKTASSECSTCHASDIGIQSAMKKKSMAVVGIADTWDSCYRCHDPAPCTRCHGVVMPHPPGWGPPPVPINPTFGGITAGSSIPPGSHPRQGFANREACWRCHHAPGQLFTPDDQGCVCHGVLGSMHGGSAWINEHGLEATGQKTGITSNCATCHGAPELFCSFCHPASFAALYSPQPLGPDSYTRLEEMSQEDLSSWFGKDGLD